MADNENERDTGEEAQEGGDAGDPMDTTDNEQQQQGEEGGARDPPAGGEKDGKDPY